MALKILFILSIALSCTEKPKTIEDSPKYSDKTAECKAHQLCGLKADGSSTQCRKGQSCIVLKVCNTAICIDSQKACQLECGSKVKNCMIQESYPSRIGCPKG